MRNSVTISDYYRYRVAVRQQYVPGDNSIWNWSSIHNGGKLFQQYVLDGWIKVDSNNVNYYRQFQSKLRVEMYSGLMDYVQNQAAANGVPPGRVVVLPSTHQVAINNN